ncbi:hypothetical protein MPTK1_7g12000 [Marchantia polymorpha subsp. ruderalis]|uniref:Uncharacterized protein n=2 Tax=Marchantia polymorpha TaxID=3197 RepID=A0AAF6BYL8_MARPO|nr:hypothetical protein MARPO_0003s0214 [Marchantia polymorpha]BBN17102.1 hypothetical protein Mp_7g12000 [Marchantia polymorpha subsp. ruderalis]|eukprot:PTQ49341.1 hypothetical protein MARPO_0003s0214 [Marchantia polymorpha]
MWSKLMSHFSGHMCPTFSLQTTYRASRRYQLAWRKTSFAAVYRLFTVFGVLEVYVRCPQGIWTSIITIPNIFHQRKSKDLLITNHKWRKSVEKTVSVPADLSSMLLEPLSDSSNFDWLEAELWPTHELDTVQDILTAFFGSSVSTLHPKIEGSDQMMMLTKRTDVQPADLVTKSN